ncbi:cytochrome c biogenesis CcdA family protein [Variovorax dokdonensis]|uniref:Cytochrome c biogenesis CcdA family protein n=1 Tax=Variovorax dokdonensis TaxID=344883 RepID=A0ABT7N8C2_9BURK|nr:cytochrome c biogenesis CcdA family protein [Variovorax dokdonensis]MDM0044182.1 cytochrome c biogenesis CcdA family protein [Variovorax dokdonensis]
MSNQIAIAFLAGVATIAAPCVLPALPVILGGSVGTAGRGRPLVIVAGFVAAFAGVTLAFSLFNHIAGVSPQALRNLAIAGLLLFGLSMLWRAPFKRAFAAAGRALAPLGTRPVGTGLPGAFLIGLTLGAVWTPCAGPALGLVLVALATEPEPHRAAVVLCAYAVGAGVPMLLLAYSGQWASARARWLAQHLGAIQRGLGLLVVATAVAMFLQYDVVFTAWALRFLPAISQGL